MIEAVIHRIRCDGCRGAWISREGNTPAISRGEAAVQGWEHREVNGGWFDYCPRCVQAERIKARTAAQ